MRALRYGCGAVKFRPDSGATPLSTKILIAVALGGASLVLAFNWMLISEAGYMAREDLRQEARILSQELGAAIAACSDPNRSDGAGRGRPNLPPQSREVPQKVPDVRGYLGTDADWQDEAFRCARFRPLKPIHVKLQWKLRHVGKGWQSGSYDQQGEVGAAMDLDGDGTGDFIANTAVACDSHMCTVSTQAGESSL